MKKITLYLCGKCGEEFRSKRFCEQHEQSCKAQNCEVCVHGILVLDRYYRCARFLLGKDCKFELKERGK